MPGSHCVKYKIYKFDNSAIISHEFAVIQFWIKFWFGRRNILFFFITNSLQLLHTYAFRKYCPPYNYFATTARSNSPDRDFVLIYHRSHPSNDETLARRDCDSLPRNDCKINNHRLPGDSHCLLEAAAIEDAYIPVDR